MTPFSLAVNLHLDALTGLDLRVIVLPLLLGLGLYLTLTALPLGRPKPDLGERLRQLDVDERLRLAELGKHATEPLFSSQIGRASCRERV